MSVTWRGDTLQEGPFERWLMLYGRERATYPAISRSPLRDEGCRGAGCGLRHYFCRHVRLCGYLLWKVRGANVVRLKILVSGLILVEVVGATIGDVG